MPAAGVAAERSPAKFGGRTGYIAVLAASESALDETPRYFSLHPTADQKSTAVMVGLKLCQACRS